MAQKPSLYREEDFRYTEEALALTGKILTVVGPIFNDYLAKGYSLREISHVVQSAVGEIELDAVLEIKR